MVTIYDIARHCNVSPATVSKVINNYKSISSATIKKVTNAMKELDYIPNNSAKYLSKGVSNNVGILACFRDSITPFTHPFFMEILNSFQLEMNKNKYELLFVSRNVAGNTETFYKNCISRHIDGVLMLGEMHNKEMAEVIRSKIPGVGFDYVGNYMAGVSSNNYELMAQLTEHVISLGHTNIVYIAGEPNEITNNRINGFKDTLKKHNISYENNIIQSRYVDLEDIELLTNELLKRKNRPTVIMYPDDYSAMRGIDTIRKAGLDCPKDISVTGFDGIEVGQIYYPRLTTAKQDTKKIGTLLAKQLLLEMKNKKSIEEQIIIPGSIVIGMSTAQLNNQHK